MMTDERKEIDGKGKKRETGGLKGRQEKGRKESQVHVEIRGFCFARRSYDGYEFSEINGGREDKTVTRRSPPRKRAWVGCSKPRDSGQLRQVTGKEGSPLRRKE